MRFLKLLDPHDRPFGLDGPVMQQRRADEMFPSLVAASRLHYWRPGDAVVNAGTRLLIGLAASYNLEDLRLADVVNDALKTARTYPVHIDVFNTNDCQESEDLSKYFPDVPTDKAYYAHPIVGVWENGVYKHTLFGHDARASVLRTLGSPLTADQVTANLRPPDRSLMED